MPAREASGSAVGREAWVAADVKVRVASAVGAGAEVRAAGVGWWFFLC